MKKLPIRQLSLAAMTAAALALGACATPFRADVARFQTQLPAPQGQSFTIEAGHPALAGGIEFGQYAGLVAGELTRYGYRPAAPGERPEMIVRMSYDIDKGRERVRSTPGFGYNDVESYTVYTTGLDLQISRASDGYRLFEGRAEAQSRDNNHQTIIPNLIEAMFTNFPGNSGEKVRITVAPPEKG